MVNSGQLAIGGRPVICRDGRMEPMHDAGSFSFFFFFLFFFLSFFLFSPSKLTLICARITPQTES